MESSAMSSNTEPLVRMETKADLESIRRVHQLAFGQIAEARLVDDLRVEGYLRASFVAEVNSEIVGHVGFSDLKIITDDRTISALALGPMAVLPSRQNRGIGSAILRHGLKVCQEQGHTIVIVLGHPHFYQRFGFNAKLTERLASPFAGRASFMALELTPGALDGVLGLVQFAPPFEQVRKVRRAQPGDEAEWARMRVTGNVDLTVPKPGARSLTLLVLNDTLAVCRLASDAVIPPWAESGCFLSVTRTDEELSIVCSQDRIPNEIPCEQGWRCLRVAGKISFSEVGVLSSLSVPLATAGISIFAVSTFDTDYILVKQIELAAAVAVLEQQGHTVRHL